MNARINFQTLLGEDGKPAFVVVPIDEFRRLTGFTPGTVPNAVVNRVFDGEASTMSHAAKSGPRTGAGAGSTGLVNSQPLRCARDQRVA